MEARSPASCRRLRKSAAHAVCERTRELPPLHVQHLTLAIGRTIGRGRARQGSAKHSQAPSNTDAAPVWKTRGGRAPLARDELKRSGVATPRMRRKNGYKYCWTRAIKVSSSLRQNLCLDPRLFRNASRYIWWRHRLYIIRTENFDQISLPFPSPVVFSLHFWTPPSFVHVRFASREGYRVLPPRSGLLFVFFASRPPFRACSCGESALQ